MTTAALLILAAVVAYLALALPVCILLCRAIARGQR